MTFSPLIVLGWALGGWIAAVVLTRLVLAGLHRRAILDHPNPRSSHAVAVPRGGGLAVVPVILAGLALMQWLAPAPDRALWGILVGALALMALSFADDIRDLPPAPRFGVQAVAVGLGLMALPDGLVLQGLVPWAWADRVVVFLAWLWFVNLYNFMDGIDGITGVETGCIGLGLAGVSMVTGALAAGPAAGALIAGAAAGFLVWNWHPARIFLGDVGAIPLGYLLGFLLLSLAALGHWAAALILPMYYLADATLTLLRRAARREKVWHAHREHAYQKAVRRGLSHATVSGVILAANAGLLVLAGVAVAGAVWPAVGLAALLVAALLAFLELGLPRPGGS